MRNKLVTCDSFKYIPEMQPVWPQGVSLPSIVSATSLDLTLRFKLELEMNSGGR